MGNPNYSAEQATKATEVKSVMEEFTAWINSVEFTNDEIAAALLREIMADCTHRVQIIEDI